MNNEDKSGRYLFGKCILTKLFNQSHTSSDSMPLKNVRLSIAHHHNV